MEPYRPRKNTYEADIIDNLIDAGGGAERKGFWEVLEYMRKENDLIRQYVQGLSFDEPSPVEQDNRPMCIHPDIHAPYNHPETIEFLTWVQEWRGCQCFQRSTEVLRASRPRFPGA